MRKFLVITVGIVALLLVFSGYMYRGLFQPQQLASPQIVEITKKSSLTYIANRLKARGIIPNATAFRIYARLTGRAKKIKIGEYEVKSGLSPADILDLLVSGRSRVIRLTIPEGTWAIEIADKYLVENWPEPAKEFSSLINEKHEKWLQRMPFLRGSNSLEGFLFPDTYFIPPNASAEQIITKMLERFQSTCWAAYQADPPKDGRSFTEVLILASLVEGEAKKDEERPIIAGVYMNRLRTPGWKLDCDATLIYAKQKRVKRLFNEDKLIDSPYNSYRRQGLPPGPINNPGLKSFLAALHPANVNYFFYVARNDGSHIFSRTLAEQSANIQRLRRN